MSLDESHLRYPHRRHGMDHTRYAWRLSKDRPRWNLAGGQDLALMIVVPLEFHRLNPQGKPFKHPGAMQTPYPDLRHYTTRDYGLRVGVFRILRALKQAGLKAVFPVNAILLDRIRPLMDSIQRDGHEIAAYGWEADCIHWGGMDADAEERIVSDTRRAFDRVGLEPKTWMSPARSQSFRTLDLITKAGFEICLDWEIDTVPVEFATEGGPLLALPLSNELDDRKLLIDQRHSEQEWRACILEAAAFSKKEHERFGSQILSCSLTPYVSGQPFRNWALESVLQDLGHDLSVWSATARDIAAAWKAGGAS